MKRKADNIATQFTQQSCIHCLGLYDELGDAQSHI